MVVDGWLPQFNSELQGALPLLPWIASLNAEGTAKKQRKFKQWELDCAVQKRLTYAAQMAVPWRLTEVETFPCVNFSCGPLAPRCPGRACGTRDMTLHWDRR